MEGAKTTKRRKVENVSFATAPTIWSRSVLSSRTNRLEIILKMTRKTTMKYLGTINNPLKMSIRPLIEPLMNGVAIVGGGRWVQ